MEIYKDGSKSQTKLDRNDLEEGPVGLIRGKFSSVDFTIYGAVRARLNAIIL